MLGGLSHGCDKGFYSGNEFGRIILLKSGVSLPVDLITKQGVLRMCLPRMGLDLAAV